MPTASLHPLMSSPCDRPSLTVRATAVAQSLVRTLRVWRARIGERHAFPVLGERDLRDLRLSRWDVERELAKPFWRG